MWSFRADVAQLVEHSLGKGEVTSSILVISSRIKLPELVIAKKSKLEAVAHAGWNERLKLGAAKFIFGDVCQFWQFWLWEKGGSNSVVESQPSKLLVAGSIPVSRSRDCSVTK